MKLLHALIASAISSFVFIILKKKIDGLLMNVFRDLSRFKSRKRLYGKEAALIPLLFGLEKPVKTKIEDLLANAASVSIQELAENDGRTEDTPIYIAVNGHVYDVSASRDKYGPGGKYHALAGHDASIAFATACYEPKCLVGALPNLSESQKKDLIKWDELYAQHDKYTFVGVLVEGDAVSDSVDQALQEQRSESTTEGHEEGTADDASAHDEVETSPVDVEPVEATEVSADASEEAPVVESEAVEETDATVTNDDAPAAEEVEVTMDGSINPEE